MFQNLYIYSIICMLIRYIYINIGVQYNPTIHAGFTLYSGTTVRMTQGNICVYIYIYIYIYECIYLLHIGVKTGANGDSPGALAVVSRTGFFSAKGI